MCKKKIVFSPALPHKIRQWFCNAHSRVKTVKYHSNLSTSVDKIRCHTLLNTK